MTFEELCETLLEQELARLASGIAHEVRHEASILERGGEVIGPLPSDVLF